MGATRILGIDPGLQVTGYGVLDVEGPRVKLIEAGVVTADPRAPLSDRLFELHRGVEDVIGSLKPSAVAIEELYSHYGHPRTAILMAHARGVICLAAARHEIPIVNYAATQIKRMLTGNGRAPKSQMQHAICRELSLSSPPEHNDVADALAIALCNHFLGRQVV